MLSSYQEFKQHTFLESYDKRNYYKYVISWDE